MGFLDHSTNNIIVDAVLTDLGRMRLSQNDSSFQIVKFAFGDDEIDYSIIKKFGLTVGREKIEKNTPIFEAQTNSNYALKHKLISQSNQAAMHIPVLRNDGSDAALQAVTVGSGAGDSAVVKNRTNIPVENALLVQSSVAGGVQPINVQLRQDASGVVDLIPLDLRESVFMIKASNRFLRVSSRAGNQLPLAYLSERDQIATYRVSATGGDGAPMCQFQLAAKPTLNSTIFSTFGIGGIVTTVVTVTGLLTGASHNIVVRLAFDENARG